MVVKLFIKLEQYPVATRKKKKKCTCLEMVLEIPVQDNLGKENGKEEGPNLKFNITKKVC